MWLNEHQLDIRCVRLQPYHLEGRVLLDVQQIVPLPEAATYQVQLKEKATERRTARQQGSGPDFTRYDLRIGTADHKAQWKRNMMYLVVRAATGAGIAPEALSMPASKWLSVPSRCATSKEFEEKVRAQLGPQRVYAARRWFAEDDELIHVGDKTYVFSNQWSGPPALACIDEIAKAHPELRISYQEAVEE